MDANKTRTLNANSCGGHYLNIHPYFMSWLGKGDMTAHIYQSSLADTRIAVISSKK